uniref:hypothetical protein n=1 Tax=Shewanella sp. TaxID=50422 RepID=UPI004047F135
MLFMKKHGLCMKVLAKGGCVGKYTMRYKEFKPTQAAPKQAVPKPTAKPSAAAPPQTLAQARIEHLVQKVQQAKAELDTEVAAQRLAQRRRLAASQRRKLQRKALAAASRSST